MKKNESNFFSLSKAATFWTKDDFVFFCPRKKERKTPSNLFIFSQTKKEKKRDHKKIKTSQNYLCTYIIYTLPLPVRTHTLWTRFDHPLLFEATSALFLTKETRFFCVSNEEPNGSGDLLNDFESGLRFWTVSFYISHLDLH